MTKENIECIKQAIIAAQKMAGLMPKYNDNDTLIPLKSTNEINNKKED